MRVLGVKFETVSGVKFGSGVDVDVDRGGGPPLDENRPKSTSWVLLMPNIEFLTH